MSSLNKGHPDDPPHKKSLLKCAVELLETERPVVLVPPAPSRELRVAIDTIGKMIESHDRDGPRQSDDAFKASPKASTYIGDPDVLLLFDVDIHFIQNIHSIVFGSDFRAKVWGYLKGTAVVVRSLPSNTRQDHR